MRRNALLMMILAPLFVGCALPSMRSAKPNQAAPPVRDARRDAVLVPQYADRMRTLVAELGRISQAGAGQQRGHLLPQEQDAVERSFANYLSCRDELNQIAKHSRETAAQESKSAAHLRDTNLARSATVQRIHGDALLVSAVLDDPVMHRALNQSFYRSGIRLGVFDEIAFEITDAKTLAWLAETPALLPAQPDATWPSAAVDFDPGFGPLAAQTEHTTADAKVLVADIIRRRSWLLPEVTNDFLHSTPTRLVMASGHVVRDELVRMCSGVVTGVGRVKNPIDKPLTFSDDQKRQIHSALQPGDVLLTYTAGVVSNIFLPGQFKHAISYVGSEAERRGAGLTAQRMAWVAEPCRTQLLQAASQTTLATGEPADVIESLSEGVIFNNLDRVLDTRINRLVVLRPRLNAADRAAYLIDVFSFVGDEYDFYFDFADASDQACTEIIYRTLQGRGGIDLTLVDRAGRATLSADDIIRYHLAHAHVGFECILVGDEDRQAPGQAHILFAAQGQQRLAERLGVPSSSAIARRSDARSGNNRGIPAPPSAAP